MGWGVIPQCTALLFKLYFTLHILGLLWATALDKERPLLFSLLTCYARPQHIITNSLHLELRGKLLVTLEQLESLTAP